MYQARQNKPIDSGGNLGLVCGNFLSGALTSAYGWEIVFYVLGLLLVIWFCFWSFLCYNEPGAHPRISKVRMESDFRVPPNIIIAHRISHRTNVVVVSIQSNSSEKILLFAD